MSVDPGQGPVYDPRQGQGGPHYGQQPYGQEPYGQPQYEQYPAQQQWQQQPNWPGYDQGGGPGGGGPDRRILVLVGVLAIAVIGVLAFVLGTSFGHHDDTLSTAQGTATPVPGTSSAAAPSTKAAGSATASPSTSASPTLASDAYLPIPDGGSPDLDFGFLRGVTQSGNTVTVTFDRATFYTGDAATQHNGGVEPDPGYLIVNSNKKLRTFTLDPKARISGSVLLNDGDPTSTPMSRSDFVASAKAALAGSGQDGIPIWMRHVDEKNQEGAVTALAEQYLP